VTYWRKLAQADQGIALFADFPVLRDCIASGDFGAACCPAGTRRDLVDPRVGPALPPLSPCRAGPASLLAFSDRPWGTPYSDLGAPGQMQGKR